MAVEQMLRTHPVPLSIDQNALINCIQLCFDCGQTCTSCADDCLAEEQHLPHLTQCIRLNLDCANICLATGTVLSAADQAGLASHPRPAARLCYRLQPLRGGMPAAPGHGALPHLRTDLPRLHRHASASYR